MRIFRLVGGILALIGGVFFNIAIAYYVQFSTPLNMSWFLFVGAGLWAIIGGLWAFLSDIMEIKYSRPSGVFILVGGVLTLLLGLIYYLTSDFTFFPFSFFSYVLNLPEPLWIFGIPIESLLLLIGGLLISYIKDENT